MDRPIELKRGVKKKHILIGSGILTILLLVYQVLFAENISTFKADIEKLSIETIHRGTFHNYISVSGNVEPIATIILDAREGGRVEEKVVEEGEMVKKGDVI